MNRRSFFQRLAYGTVATAALISLPASVVKAAGLSEAGNHWAIERLRRAWMAYHAAHGTYPGAYRVGREFFALYQSELTANQRFCATMEPEYTTPTLLFKGAIVYVSPQWVTASTVAPMPPYGVQATSAVEWRKHTTIRLVEGAHP